MAKGNEPGWFSLKVLSYAIIGALVVYVAIDFFR